MKTSIGVGRRARLAVVALLSSFGLAISLTGCAVAVGSGSCDFNVQNAHNRHSNTTVMNAKAVVKCTVPVTNASMTIKMQRLVGGGWQDVAGTQRTTSESSMVAGRGYQFATYDVPCVNGTYRAGARGKAYFHGQPSGSDQWQYGNSAAINCKS